MDQERDAMTVMSKTVWEEGKAAKQAGQADSVNPYPAGSQNSADWLDGYTFDEVEQNVDRAENDV